MSKIKQIEKYINKLEYGKELQLNESTYIKCVKSCLESHLKYLKANSGNKRYMPYYNHIIKIIKHDFPPTKR